MLTLEEIKQAWLESEQSRGFLGSCTIEDLSEDIFDEVDIIHGEFIAKAQEKATLVDVGKVLKKYASNQMLGVITMPADVLERIKNGDVPVLTEELEEK